MGAMAMTELSKEKLESLLVEKIHPNINPRSFSGIYEVVNRAVQENKPEAFAVNHRDEAITIFAPKRKGRKPTKGCPICKGETTPVLFYEELPSGNYAFVNENMYPALVPEGIPNVADHNDLLKGVHLLVWPTNKHKDIHQIMPDDHAVTFQIFSTLEDILRKRYPNNATEWNMEVIKNTGKPVGSSIDHGHYQVIFVNKQTKKTQKDKRFLCDYGKSFASHLLRNASRELRVKSYNSVEVVIPYYMRRPLTSVIIPKEDVTSFGDLTKEQCEDFARATSFVAHRFSTLMPKMGKEFAYNLVFHTGPIGRMYIEAMPYTQPDGGLEKIAVNLCQSSPETSAQKLSNL